MFLLDWKNNPNRLPLIVKGARQIGKQKLFYILEKNYKSIIEINFVLRKQYKDFFDDGFEIDNILKNISLKNPNLEFPIG